MPPLPSVSGERAAKAFQRAGWIKDRQRGSQRNSNQARTGRKSFRASASNTRFRYIKSPDPSLGNDRFQIP